MHQLKTYRISVFIFEKRHHIDKEIAAIGYRKNSPVLVLGDYPKPEWSSGNKRYKRCDLISHIEYMILIPIRSVILIQFT